MMLSRPLCGSASAPWVGRRAYRLGLTGGGCGVPRSGVHETTMPKFMAAEPDSVERRNAGAGRR